MNITNSPNLVSLYKDFSTYHGENIQPLPQPSQPADAAPESAQSAQGIPADNPRSLHSELNEMLRNISRETYRTVNTGDIVSLINDAKAESTASNDVISALDDIRKTAKTAQKALADASEIKAAKLLKDVRSAAAKNPDKTSEAIDPEKIGSLKALVKAAEAQSKMSDKLLKLFNEGSAGLPDGFREKLADLAETCDRRASEFYTLAMQMTALADEINAIAAAEKQHAVDKGTKDAVKATFAGVLGRTVGDLAKDMGGTMHGNHDTLIKAGSDEAFTEIDEIYSASASDKVKNDKLQQIENALKSLSANLAPTQDPVNSLAERMDERVRKRFVSEIDTMAKRLEEHKRTIATQMRKGIAAEYHCPIACELETDYKDDKLSDDFAVLFKGMKLRQEFEAALQTYAETGTKDARNEVIKKGKELRKYADAILNDDQLHKTAKSLYNFACEAGSKSKANIKKLRALLSSASIHSVTMSLSDDLTRDMLEIKERLMELETAINDTSKKMDAMMLTAPGTTNDDRLKNLSGKQRKQYDAWKGKLSNLKKNKLSLDQKLVNLNIQRKNLVKPVKSILVNQLGFASDHTDDYIEVPLARIDEFPLPKSNGQRRLPALRSSDVINILRGNGRLSDLFKFDLNRINPEVDADPTLNDDNLESEKTLGSGAANTVSLLQYNDGRKIIFKPEHSGSIGIQRLDLSGNSYEYSQQAAKLNLAAGHAARLLGCEKRIVKTRVMYHNGVYGIGMDFAEGVPAHQLNDYFIDLRSTKEICDKLKRELQKNPHSQMRDDVGRTINDTFEQTTDLQWCDLMSGQGDRHRNNFFVHVAPGTHEVSVAGIDNDMCFPTYRTGLTKIKVSGDYLEIFKAKIYGHLDNKDDHKKVMEQFPIQHDDDAKENYIEIDFADNRISSEALAALTETYGFMTLSLPPFMSANMYNHLMQLCSDPEKMKKAIADFGKYMPKENVEMAEQRLKEMIDIAIEYKKNGQIIDSRDPGNPSSRPWLDKKVLEKLQPINAENLAQMPDQDKPFICINHANSAKKKKTDDLACRRRQPLVTRDFNPMLEIADIINNNNPPA